MDMFDTDEEMRTWRRNTMMVGAVLGAMVGAAAAYLYTQKADDPDHRPEFSTGEGVRLGLLLLGLVRQITELGNTKS